MPPRSKSQKSPHSDSEFPNIIVSWSPFSLLSSGLYVVHLLGTNKLDLSLFRPCEYCPVTPWLARCRTRHGVHRSLSSSGELVYVFVMLETMHGVLCWRTSWCFLLFFSFGAAAHLPNMRNISLRGPSGRVAQWRTAVPLYFQKSLSLGTTSFFFFSTSSEIVCESYRPLK